MALGILIIYRGNMGNNGKEHGSCYSISGLYREYGFGYNYHKIPIHPMFYLLKGDYKV